MTITQGFFAALCLFLAGCACPLPEKESARTFDFARDHFAFANETVWNYVNGEVLPRETEPAPGTEHYTRRCFVVSRAALQFWKFARFDREGWPLGDKDLADRIRQVAALDVWETPLPMRDRVVFPGYDSLYAISKAHPRVFEQNIGLGWPTYFRFGNMRIVFPPTRGDQKNLQEELEQTLALGYPKLLWLVNFPSLSINHAVVVYSTRQQGGEFIYHVYDPNYYDSPKTLRYDTATRTFFYQPTFYFKGGKVDARAVYMSPFE